MDRLISGANNQTHMCKLELTILLCAVYEIEFPKTDSLPLEQIDSD